MQVVYDEDTLKDYRTTQEQFYMTLYGNIIKHDKFFHTLRFLNFYGEGKKTRGGGPEPDASYDQLWASSMIHMLNTLKITAQPNI